jgi:hypothetical protein
VFLAVDEVHLEVVDEGQQLQECFLVRPVLLELKFKDLQKFKVEVVKRFEQLKHQLRLVYSDS